jgi:hypothetical protein
MGDSTVYSFRRAVRKMEKRKGKWKSENCAEVKNGERSNMRRSD